MTSFPILYSRTNTGAIRTWQIVVVGDAFYTVSGQIDGEKTESEKTVCFGKNLNRANQTSASEQALSEAQSKFDKKLKTGYFTDIGAIDNFYYVEAMLAEPLHKVKKGLRFPALVQCKYNGGRVLADNRGLFSRKGERYLSIPHIEEAIQPILDKYPDIVLDGEAFNEDLREQLNEMMKILRKCDIPAGL